ncbi:hypothetical protein ACOZ4Y_02710 [Komagataeibacter rhaeticus]|nr:hypothetical protein [Komagataeibacter rhaeticus]
MSTTTVLKMAGYRHEDIKNYNGRMIIKNDTDENVGVMSAQVAHRFAVSILKNA